MKRLAFLFAGGALWLFVAALPALADGGPHVKALNNGSAGLTSDNCAGCHRAHVAQGAYLLKEEEPALCLSCHGSAGTGATTNVADGVQYALASDTSVSLRGSELGALRGGGFAYARIGSGSAVGVSYASGTSIRRESKVPALASGQAVTSAHLDVAGPGTSTVWGNGALGTTGAGATGVTLECTSCHNPHGNGQYRILNPIPAPLGATDAGFVAAGTGVTVTDAALPGPGDVRNYTVIQLAGGTGSLLASQVIAGGYASTAGDYLHRKVPWNAGNQVAGTGSATSYNDAPNGDATNFNAQINAWCATCHTRYTTSALTGWGTVSGVKVNTVVNGSIENYASGGSYNNVSGDEIFKYRHSTTSNKPCTTCHVAHGSNAQMTGFNSTHESYPAAGGSSNDPTAVANTSSRLLKADNRGTCQLCHDPTDTATTEGVVFPAAAPVPSYP